MFDEKGREYFRLTKEFDSKSKHELCSIAAKKTQEVDELKEQADLVASSYDITLRQRNDLLAAESRRRRDLEKKLQGTLTWQPVEVARQDVVYLVLVGGLPQIGRLGPSGKWVMRDLPVALYPQPTHFMEIPDAPR